MWELLMVEGGAPTNAGGAAGNQPGADIAMDMSSRDGPVNFSVGPGYATISPKWGVGGIRPYGFMCGGRACYTANPRCFNCLR
jgi:hypothetical protein